MPSLIDLATMRNTVRRMTARYSPQQMQDTQIDNYINLAYTIHFPLQFKNSKLTKPYIFNTTPNVDTYPFPYENGLATTPAGDPIPGNIQVGPPVYCQGYLLSYFQDQTQFYNLWPMLSSNQIISSGTGIATSTYTGTIPNFPFYRAKMDILGNVTQPGVIISSFDDSGYQLTLTDVPYPGLNTGQLIGDNNFPYGLINYVTGNYTFNLISNAIPAGVPIYASVVPYQGARPISCLFYNQQLVLRPVPAQIYQILFTISQQPTELIADGDMPELDEWYLFICAIAAKLIYTDFPDPQGMQDLMPTYQEQLQLAQRRTLRQMSSQRVATIFSTPGTRNGWANNGIYYGSEYSGGF